MSEVQRTRFALQEKAKGNECFKAGEADASLSHYSRYTRKCVCVCGTAAAVVQSSGKRLDGFQVSFRILFQAASAK